MDKYILIITLIFTMQFNCQNLLIISIKFKQTKLFLTRVSRVDVRQLSVLFLDFEGSEEFIN